MSETKFFTGQKVKLKSGGPLMTVMGVNALTFGADQMTVCQWFAGSTLRQGEFPNANLELATGPTPARQRRSVNHRSAWA